MHFAVLPTEFLLPSD